ncbi:hypothetical protein [Actinomadura rayongensis]|uniref:Uncharacterized protein n=1 Tax=Actinomadura rayongensis TaxID=1429076 RepID=A0A6I4W8W0_9ACTN|nr:hypothetical protein [Actinomadura rayongensis]MXQ65613.1 hypothetical protein [Actinomadura rayongensis]
MSNSNDQHETKLAQSETQRESREPFSDACEVLQRIGVKIERGLAEARRFDGGALLPTSSVLVPSFDAVELADTQIGGRAGGTGAAWLTVKEDARHYGTEDIVEAAFEITRLWGKALACVADNNNQDAELMNRLAEIEGGLDHALAVLEASMATKASDRSYIESGRRRIKEIVEDASGAERLLRDLLHYLSEGDNLAKVVVDNVVSWDDEYGDETGEAWYTDPDEVFAQMVAALRDNFGRQNPDDADEAWGEVLSKAEEINRLRRVDPADPS